MLPAPTWALCPLTQQPPAPPQAPLWLQELLTPPDLGSPSTEGPRAAGAYGSAGTRWLQRSQDPLVLSWKILKMCRKKQKLRGEDFESEALLIVQCWLRKSLYSCPKG